MDMEILEEIVRTDNKQRYSFNEDKTLIRANQGHSIPVDVELPLAEPPEYLWHGTGEKYVSSIDAQGLIPKSRLYVHLSADEVTAKKVGSRHGRPVIYRVATGQMYRNGIEFRSVPAHCHFHNRCTPVKVEYKNALMIKENKCRDKGKPFMRNLLIYT